LLEKKHQYISLETFFTKHASLKLKNEFKF
jgi:hypothetical protein